MLLQCLFHVPMWYCCAQSQLLSLNFLNLSCLLSLAPPYLSPSLSLALFLSLSLFLSISLYLSIFPSLLLFSPSNAHSFLLSINSLSLSTSLSFLSLTHSIYLSLFFLFSLSLSHFHLFNVIHLPPPPKKFSFISAPTLREWAAALTTYNRWSAVRKQ